MLQYLLVNAYKVQLWSLITDSSGINYCPHPEVGQPPFGIIRRAETRSVCGWWCCKLGVTCTGFAWYDDSLLCQMFNVTPPTSMLMQPIGHCWAYIVSEILISYLTPVSVMVSLQLANM